MATEDFEPKALSWARRFGLYIVNMSRRRWVVGTATRGANRGRANKRFQEMALDRDEVLLVMLSLAHGDALTPVKIQKALFLADKKAKAAFNTTYDFKPYDYGPFDRYVYVDAANLSRRELVEIGVDQSGGWNTYAATPRGIEEGKRLQGQLAPEQLTMLARIVELVQSLSFTELVSAIYRAYPEMRERSVFRE